MVKKTSIAAENYLTELLGHINNSSRQFGQCVCHRLTVRVSMPHVPVGLVSVATRSFYSLVRLNNEVVRQSRNLAKKSRGCLLTCPSVHAPPFAF